MNRMSLIAELVGWLDVLPEDKIRLLLRQAQDTAKSHGETIDKHTADPDILVRARQAFLNLSPAQQKHHAEMAEMATQNNQVE